MIHDRWDRHQTWIGYLPNEFRLRSQSPTQASKMDYATYTTQTGPHPRPGWHPPTADRMHCCYYTRYNLTPG